MEISEIRKKNGPLKISVVIPSYNKGKYIMKTINSVLSQPYQNIEIIVVDDGSIDNTKDILEPYINNKKIIYYWKENDGFKGPGGAINLGIEKSSGDLIHCLDADDLVTDMYYETVVEEFLACGDFMAAATEAIKIDENDNIIGEFKSGYFKNRSEFMLESLHHNPIISSSMMVKKRCYEEVGLRRPEFEISDDYELRLRIGESYTIRNIEIPFIKYRIHSEGISTDIAKIRQLDHRIISAFRSRHSIKDFFPEVSNWNANLFAQAHLILGELLFKRGFWDLAVKDLRCALDYDKSLVKAYTFMASSLVNLGEVKEALRVLKVEMIRKLPNMSYKGSYTHEDLPKIFSETDMTIVPSINENYPLVILESLGAGVPVIASKVAGIPEIIKDDENGFLFEPANPKDMAEKIDYLIAKPEIIKKFKENLSHVKTLEEEADQLEIISMRYSNINP